MKFFKHFTDAHEGKSMTALMNEWGLEGYAAYFILMELCAKKLEKHADETVTVEHCRFVFNERTLREKLRMRSTKVELFLNSCSTLVLLQFTRVKDEFNFYVPKLLECLDRDAKRARPERGQPAPKNKKKIKNNTLSGWQSEAFDLLANLYSKEFPETTMGGASARKRFGEQIREPEHARQLEVAIKNYSAYLKSLTWDRQPKTTFANFLGTPSSGYFWTEFIKPKLIARASGVVPD